MFTLAHLSDPHLPMPEARAVDLLCKRATGYFNWWRHRVHVHAPEALAGIVADIKAQKPDHIALTGDHALRRQGDGLQAQGAKTVHRHAGDGDRTAGAQGHLARDVGASGTLGRGATHDDVVDLGGLNAGAGNGVLHGVAAQRGAMGHVE